MKGSEKTELDGVLYVLLYTLKLKAILRSLRIYLWYGHGAEFHGYPLNLCHILLITSN